MTNGDRIRRMSDEELFDEYIVEIHCCDCQFNRVCKTYQNGGGEYQECKRHWLKWMGEEEQ